MDRREARVVPLSPVVSCQAGKSRALVVPLDEQRPGPGDGVLLEFQFGREPPTNVALRGPDGWRPGLQLAPGRWWMDLEGVRSAPEWSLRWMAPAAGGSLRSACFCDAVAAGRSSYDLLEDYRGVRDRFGLDRAPRDMRRFFLLLDLVTATAEIQAQGLHARVAAESGVDEVLLKALRPRPVEGLREFLFARWRTRAVAHAAGCDPRRLLPSMISHRRTGEQVLAVVLRLLHLEFGSQLEHAWLWDQIVSFGTGALRIDVPGERFNCEPNSVAFACFAELFALGCEPDSGLEGQALEDCRALRVMFVSALEGYLDAYLSVDSRPRRIACYHSSALAPGERSGEQRWPAARRAGLIRAYSRRCPLDVRSAAGGGGTSAGAQITGRAFAEGEAWLLERWGAVLRRGLSDEPDVAAVAHSRR